MSREDKGLLALARSNGSGSVRRRGDVSPLSYKPRRGHVGGTHPRRITAPPRRWPQIKSAFSKKYRMFGPPPGYARTTVGADVDTPMSAYRVFVGCTPRCGSSGRVPGSSLVDPNVWTDRALQEEFSRWVSGPASMYPASWWSSFAPGHDGY